MRLKDLKNHTNAVGGAWGDDTWAAMVKDNCEAVFDATDEDAAGLEDTVAKRSLLIPINVFTSSHIIKLASFTGQTEDYQKFGADEETPSGVLEVMNSTQRTGSSFNMLLSDVSSIQRREVLEDDAIDFEELSRPVEENFLEETGGHNDEDAYDVSQEDSVDANNVSEDSEKDDMSLTCQEDDEEFEFTNKKKPNLSKTMKSRNITVLDTQDKTFFVCNCGFSSTSQSGSSRHRCRKAAAVEYKCTECGQIRRNPGSLKRHTTAKHKPSESLQVRPVFSCGVCNVSFQSKDDLGAHKLTSH